MGWVVGIGGIAAAVGRVAGSAPPGDGHAVAHPAPPDRRSTVPRLVDAGALAEWFRVYGPMVHRRCAGLLRSDAEADDATQEVFVRVWRRAQATGGVVDDRPVSYLWQTATRVCLNRLRSQRRHPEHPVELLDAVAALDDGVGTSAVRRALDRIFAREPPSTRTMAVLHFVDGLTLEETAAEVGLSVSGVRKRLRVLQAKLQQSPEREELP
jgi:RNA polymerase sigma-70 factor (ECF subfamily)